MTNLESMARHHPAVGHLVVGTDGSREAESAVVWAAREADLRGADLSVVHVVPAGTVGRNDGHGDRHAAEAELTESVHRARAECRAHVRRLLVTGDPIDKLLGLAPEADLLVVGARGLSAAASKIVGSTSLAVATSAPCPVIVVRPAHTIPRLFAPSRGRIVVGIDETGEVEQTLTFAFIEAALHGWGLTALHTYARPAPSLDENWDWSKEHHAAQASASHVVGEWSKGYERVDVIARTFCDAPDHAIIAETADAALVVIGRQADRPASTPRLTAPALEILFRADCPVAVMPGDIQSADRSRAAAGDGRSGAVPSASRDHTWTTHLRVPTVPPPDLI